jgi:hypothetical protein
MFARHPPTRLTGERRDGSPVKRNGVRRKPGDEDDTEMKYDAGLAERSARPRADQTLVLIEAVQISCAALSHSSARCF